MKAIVVLMLVIGLVIAGVYFFGGYQSFDPDQQGKDAKAAIKPGMTWTQVIGVAGENPKLQTISVSKRKVGNRTVEERMLGPKVEFNQKRVANRLAANEYPHGFILCYAFSEQVAFDVAFDGKGVVLDVADAMTIADLLQSRER
jgi:hypothetical protein